MAAKDESRRIDESNLLPAEFSFYVDVRRGIEVMVAPTAPY